jgi:hypothetical protein
MSAAGESGLCIVFTQTGVGAEGGKAGRELSQSAAAYNMAMEKAARSTGMIVQQIKLLSETSKGAQKAGVTSIVRHRPRPWVGDASQPLKPHRGFRRA